MKEVVWWLLTVVYAPDFEKWMRWSPIICYHPLSYYSLTDVHYPPLGSLLPALVWYVGTHGLGWDPHSWTFRVLWKVPVWIGAVACLYLIRRANVGNVGTLITAASMTYPCVFWQLDTISMALALATIVLRGKSAGMCAALATWTKPTAGVVVLPFLDRESIPTFLLISIFLCGPYVVVNGWSFFQDVVMFQVSRPPQNCSIWTLIHGHPQLESVIGTLPVILPLAMRGDPKLMAECMGLGMLAFSKIVNPNYWSVVDPVVCLSSWKQGALTLSTEAFFVVSSTMVITKTKGYYNSEDGRWYGVRELFVPPPPSTLELEPRISTTVARHLLEVSILYHFSVTSLLYARNLVRLAVSS